MKEFLSDLCGGYLHDLNPQKPSWLEQIKKEGEQEQVPIVGDDVGVLLKLFCSLIRPKKILEVGCGYSYSTHWMLLGFPSASIDALDVNEQRLSRCKYFLEKSGFNSHVKLHNEWGIDFLHSSQGGYDLIFLDSVKKGYKNLLEPALKKLNISGYLVVDNILFGGKVVHLNEDQEKKYRKGAEALDDFNKQASARSDLDSTFLNIGDGILIGRKIR